MQAETRATAHAHTFELTRLELTTSIFHVWVVGRLVGIHAVSVCNISTRKFGAANAAWSLRLSIVVVVVVVCVLSRAKV